MTKVTTERKGTYNVLWADPKASPQVSLTTRRSSSTDLALSVIEDCMVHSALGGHM